MLAISTGLDHLEAKATAKARIVARGADAQGDSDAPVVAEVKGSSHHFLHGVMAKAGTAYSHCGILGIHSPLHLVAEIVVLYST
jgi:hypothetical protein